MNGRRVTLAEVVRAQVATLFGKFRPAGGLSAEEQAAVRAERVEFADRLVALLRAIDANEAAVVQEVRRITRELYNDTLARLPSVEFIALRVKAAFRASARPTCFACEEIGGRYLWNGDDAPLMPKAIGEVEYPGGAGWLCLQHHGVAHWYGYRECRRRGIPGVGGVPRIFEYPPPTCLLPRGVTALAGDSSVLPWTDGVNMGPTARWAVAYMKKAHGWVVGETEQPLLAEVPERAPDAGGEAWRDL